MSVVSGFITRRTSTKKTTEIVFVSVVGRIIMLTRRQRIIMNVGGAFVVLLVGGIVYLGAYLHG